MTTKYMKDNKIKQLLRSERKVKRERLYSTNFPANMQSSDIKCWVPWEDYLSLKKRYLQLHKRYMRGVK